MRWFACLLSALFAAVAATAAAPNIVILLADDLGYGDLGCYGHPTIRTPNLDRMAAEGLRFTDFYSAAEVCTPSRAALLTGRYPVRSGMCSANSRVLRRTSKGGLPADEVTLAELLKSRGYATACIGKWHLGVFSIDPAHHPQQHGFDRYLGLPHSNDMDPADAPPGTPARSSRDPARWNSPLYRGTNLVEQPVDQTTLTRRYTEEAAQFIRENKSRPFFLYLPHTFPHTPLFASADYAGRSRRGLYGDVVEELDGSAGAILRVLKDEGLAGNTLVFFTSDNGPWLTQGLDGGSAGLLRDGKGSTWEGGMRVPCLAWWPGRIKPGGVTDALACNMDFYATCAALAGAALPAGREFDSVDIAPVLFGAGPSPRTSLFFYRGPDLYAVREGLWKAHFITRPAYGPGQPERHDPPVLYHLGEDPGEQKNGAARFPARAAELKALAERHLAGVTNAPSQLD